MPAVFAAALRAAGLPLPVREHRFHPTRKWRLDYAWPDQLVALEVEGGAYTRGRHTRGAGFIADMLKYSTAAAMGWAVIRCTPKDLCSTQTLGLLRQALALPREIGLINRRLIDGAATRSASGESWLVPGTGVNGPSWSLLATGPDAVPVGEVKRGLDAAFAAAREENLPPPKRRGKGRAA